MNVDEVSASFMLSLGFIAACHVENGGDRLQDSKSYLTEPTYIQYVEARAVGEPEVVARFEASIVDAFLPSEPIQAIPVGYDPRFGFTVRVERYLEGTLPGGNTQLVTFLVHSPAMFFAFELGHMGEEMPKGSFTFTLSSQRYDDGLRLRPRPLSHRSVR
jgi:hypothetical protein